MTAIKARGEAPIRGAGDKFVLLFRNSDLKRIEAERGGAWFNEFVDAVVTGTISMELVDLYLKHGVKTTKDRQPAEIPEETLDTMPVDYLIDDIFDAICIAKRGMSAKEYMAETFKLVNEAAGAGQLPPGESPDGTSSTTSDESASGQESA